MQDFRRTDSMSKTDEFFNFDLHSFDVNKNIQSLKVAFHDEDRPYEKRVCTMLCSWERFAGLATKGDFNDVEVLSKALYKESLFLVLNGEWPSLSRVVKTHLKVTLQRCVTVLNDHPSSLSQCQKLSELVTDPWGSPELRKVLYGESLEDDAALELCVSETALLLQLRLEMLCQSKCEDLALNLSQICARCVQNTCDKGVHFKSTCTDGQAEYFTDIYLLLLHKFKKVKELINELKSVSAEDIISTTTRLLDRGGQKDVGRIWKSSVKLAEFISQYFIAKSMSEPIFPQLPDLINMWCDVQAKVNVDHEDLEGMIRKLAGQYASSSAHVYLFIQSVLNKFKPRYKTLCIELYIRALTTDINSLESLKVGGDGQAVKECEVKLAEGFMWLSHLLAEYNGLCRECVLTAFSLEPTLERYQRLQELAGVSSTSEKDSAECERLKDSVGNVESSQSVNKINRSSDKVSKIEQTTQSNHLNHSDNSKSDINVHTSAIVSKSGGVYSSGNSSSQLTQDSISKSEQFGNSHFVNPSNFPSSGEQETRGQIMSLKDLSLIVCRALVRCDPDLCLFKCCCEFPQLCNTSRLEYLKNKIREEVPPSELCVENPLSKTESADSLDVFMKLSQDLIDHFSELHRQSKSNWSSSNQKKRRTNVSALVSILGQQITESLNYDVLVAPSQVLEAENLGLSKQLCDDLSVVLSGPRWHILTWALEWAELGQLCEQYLYNKEEMKNLTKELKFLEPDINHYNIQEKKSRSKRRGQVEDEYAGIEKGYERFLDLNSDTEVSPPVVTKKRKSSSSKSISGNTKDRVALEDNEENLKLEKKVKLLEKKKKVKPRNIVRKRTPSDTSVQLDSAYRNDKPQLPCRPSSALDMTYKSSSMPTQSPQLEPSSPAQSPKTFKSPNPTKKDSSDGNVITQPVGNSPSGIMGECQVSEVCKPRMNTLASVLDSVIENEFRSSQSPAQGQCVHLSSKLNALKQQSEAKRAILNPTLTSQNLCGVYHSTISKQSSSKPRNDKNQPEIKNPTCNTQIKKYCNSNTPLSSLEQSPGALLGVCLRKTCHLISKPPKSKKSTNRPKNSKKAKAVLPHSVTKSGSTAPGDSSMLDSKSSPALPRFQHAFMSKAPYYPLQTTASSDGKGNGAAGSKKASSLKSKSQASNTKSGESKAKRKQTHETTKSSTKAIKASIGDGRVNTSVTETKKINCNEGRDSPLLASQVCLKSNVTNPSVIQRMHWYKKDEAKKSSQPRMLDKANKSSDFLLGPLKPEKSSQQHDVRDIFPSKLLDSLNNLNLPLGKVDCRSSTLKEVNKFSNHSNVYHAKEPAKCTNTIMKGPEQSCKPSVTPQISGEHNRTEGLLRKLELDVLSRLSSSGPSRKLTSPSEDSLGGKVKVEMESEDMSINNEQLAKYSKATISYSSQIELADTPQRNILPGSVVEEPQTASNRWGSEDDKALKTELPSTPTLENALGSSSSSLQDQLREFECVLNKVKSDKLAEAKKAAEARERQALMQNQLVSVNLGSATTLSPGLTAVTTIANVKLPGNQVIQKIPAQIIYSPTGSRLNILGHSLEGLVGAPGKKIMVNLVAMPSPGGTKPITTTTKLIIDPASTAALNSISKMSLSTQVTPSASTPEVPPVAVVKTTSITSGNSTVIVTTAVMTTVTSVTTAQNSPLSSSVSVSSSTSSSTSSSCSPLKKPCSPAEVKTPTKCAKTPPPCLNSVQKPKTPPRPMPPKPNQVQDDPETIQKVQAILEEYKREQMKLPPEEQMKPAQRRNAFSASVKSLGKGGLKKKSPSKCIGQNSTGSVNLGQPCSPSSSVASTSSESSANLNSSSESMFGPSDLPKVGSSPTHNLCASEEQLHSEDNSNKELDLSLSLNKTGGCVLFNAIKTEALSTLNVPARLQGSSDNSNSIIQTPVSSTEGSDTGIEDALTGVLMSSQGAVSKTFQQVETFPNPQLASSQLVSMPKKGQDPFDHFVIINPSPSPCVQQCSPTVAVVPGKASNIKPIDLWEHRRGDTINLQHLLQSGKALGLLQGSQAGQTSSLEHTQDGLLAKLLTDKIEEVSSSFKHPLLDSSEVNSPMAKSWEGCEPPSEDKEDSCDSGGLLEKVKYRNCSTQGADSSPKSDVNNVSNMTSVIMNKSLMSNKEIFRVKNEEFVLSFNKLVGLMPRSSAEVTNGFDCDEIREICKEQGIVTPMDESPPSQTSDSNDLSSKTISIPNRSSDNILSLSTAKEIGNTPKPTVNPTNVNLVQIDIPKGDSSDLYHRKVIFKTENPLSNPPSNDLNRITPRGDRDDGRSCKNIVLGCSVLPNYNLTGGIDPCGIHLTPLNTSDRLWGTFSAKLAMTPDSSEKAKVSCSSSLTSKGTCNSSEQCYVRKFVPSEVVAPIVRTNDVTKESILKKLLQPSQSRQPGVAEGPKKGKESSHSIPKSATNNRRAHKGKSKLDSSAVKEENVSMVAASSNGVICKRKTDNLMVTNFLTSPVLSQPDSLNELSEDNTVSFDPKLGKLLHGSDKVLKVKKVIKEATKCITTNDAAEKCEMISDYLSRTGDKICSDPSFRADCTDLLKRTAKGVTLRKRSNSSNSNSKSCVCSSTGVKLAKLDKKRKK